MAAALDAEIGVDAVEMEHFEQMPDVESIYLAAGADYGLRGSADKSLHFAKRWSAMEARFKRAGLPLKEGTVPPAANVRHIVHGTTVIAVAFH